ncbi:MAG: SAM-dependent methyltransferase [Candidatus Magasanikbacteria bacterium CG_4_10_14_0_2_um_filter_37_12]|uniref:SAM-dependent methyltransferase n=1 Tax=Candidatus Magasanikbacteria bacterium CG_4_10_14_0_2_um_filter_37_12 TaxID=1974637 RepID=A0A2M7V7S5_9BACT|nr:MAG: SAM-dependent methyltransferase [Candidatus Magasanikbacteria bacterium CG_4_10_14_0_2_um_filter_37_12]
MPTLSILTTIKEKDYELLDSGGGEKLERYGDVVLSRPDPQALWQKHLPKKDWDTADGYFVHDSERADWTYRSHVPARWEIGFGDLNFFIKPSAFKHIGLFPEQKPNWDWMRDIIKHTKKDVSVLNLFGYTGGATLACAQAGASVVHIDGSKSAISWGKDNAGISGVSDKPIRWILEDAMKFVDREIRRENTYDGIILDPPAFGHGPNRELWKIEDHLPILLSKCKQIMQEKPLFFLINGYASGYSAIAYENNIRALFGDTGTYESGELTIQESGKYGRLLPCGIFSRWHN